MTEYVTNWTEQNTTQAVTHRTEQETTTDELDRA